MSLGLRFMIMLFTFAIITCIMLLGAGDSTSLSQSLSHLDISDLGSGLLISSMLILR